MTAMEGQAMTNRGFSPFYFLAVGKEDKGLQEGHQLRVLASSSWL